MADSIRPDGIDPLFTQPYVDVDEWGDIPVRHRYVHGGFAGTDTRFSVYFPPADSIRGDSSSTSLRCPTANTWRKGRPVSRTGSASRFERRLFPGDERWWGFGATGARRSIRPLRPTAPTPHPPSTRGSSPPRCTASTGPTAMPTAGAVAATARSGAPRTPPASGTVRPLRHRVPHGDPEHVHGAHARPAGSAPPARPDRRCGRTRWERRHVRGPRRRGAGRPHRGDAHGVSAAFVVRAPHHGDARVPGSLPGPGRGRPHLLRGLLDRAGLSGIRAPASLQRDRVQGGTSRSWPCITEAEASRAAAGRIPGRPGRRRHRMAWFG